ncbi:HNH endonuclease [Shewanella frigidimarina]|uniref:HNH endonuclease n=1 Tax=Shewanella frigidimarina TaxID=56812 RepID=UPI003D7A60B9
MTVEKARKFVIEKVLAPAIGSDGVPKKVKDIAQSQIPWIEGFKQVGDIHQYLLSVTQNKGSDLDELDAHGLATYESILPGFEKLFRLHLKDISKFSDFNVGGKYTGRDILSIVRQYDTRSGGIQLQEENGVLKAIAIKVTLRGGKYQNEWLIEDKLLKYYMKSINNDFKESYKDNAAIISSGSLPIYTFVRLNKADSYFTFKGVFKYINHFNEGQSKWFQLGIDGFVKVENLDSVNSALVESVEKALRDSSINRTKRLEKASKKPKSRSVTITVYDRNPDVVAQVLHIAQGNCGNCNNYAPFNKRKDGTPYLEVHHKIRLADGGDDSVENAIALCPNCHRKLHHG